MCRCKSSEFHFVKSEMPPPPKKKLGTTICWKTSFLFSAGYRQSYSGSETSTDLSLSSSENLSLSARQDPQSEENTQVCILPLCSESKLELLQMCSSQSKKGNRQKSQVKKKRKQNVFRVSQHDEKMCSFSLPNNRVALKDFLVILFLQLLTNPLDGLDADSNYGLLSGLGRTSNGMEIKSSNPGTFYVTGSPNRYKIPLCVLH